MPFILYAAAHPPPSWGSRLGHSHPHMPRSPSPDIVRWGFLPTAPVSKHLTRVSKGCQVFPSTTVSSTDTTTIWGRDASIRSRWGKREGLRDVRYIYGAWLFVLLSSSLSCTSWIRRKCRSPCALICFVLWKFEKAPPYLLALQDVSTPAVTAHSSSAEGRLVAHTTTEELPTIPEATHVRHALPHSAPPSP